MRFSTKAITTCAVLAALALALSYLESFFPPLLPRASEMLTAYPWESQDTERSQDTEPLSAPVRISE